MQQTLSFDGRILFLSDDPIVVTRQLNGENLSLAEAGTLRTDISTDEITPIPSLIHFDDTLSEHAHVGFKAGALRPIGLGALKAANIQVLVGGRRYGKGSSREHSPVAEQAAGVRLVIAESFERLYRQNCDNIGLITSTDYGLIARIQAGESIPMEDLLAGRDALAAAILREGGLLAFGQRHLKHAKPVALEVSGRAMTYGEKILARHILDVEGQPKSPQAGLGGFVKADFRFIHEYYTGMAAHMLHRRLGNPLDLFDPDSIIMFEDHNSYAHRSPTHVRDNLLGGIARLSQAHRSFAKQYGLKDHGYLVGEEGSEGISHAMMAETYALPGQLIVGTDSHTPHSGALGCFAYGVGTTDMANAFITGASRLTYPETLKIELTGRVQAGVSAKDIVLALLAEPRIRQGAGLGKVFEFTGPVIDGLSIDARTTLTNMTTELGGLTGICLPDARTVAFLKERRGIEFQLEDWMCSDPQAQYAEVFTLDCSAIEPMLARPGDPGNGIAASELEAPVEVHIAYGGSCTAGKRDDFDDYHVVLKWAAERNLKVASGVTFYLQCGTLAVREYCQSKGYFDTFAKVGAEILQPACGACGQCGPGVSSHADEVVISAINRNFPGRGGPGSVWLASPATVAASAIAGEIVTFEDLQKRFAPSAP